MSKKQVPQSTVEEAAKLVLGKRPLSPTPVTRMVLLGLLIDRPRDGADIQYEIEVSGLERWGDVAAGSVYSGLRTLVVLDLVAKEENPSSGRKPAPRRQTSEGKRNPRGTVYRLTEKGRSEFRRLLAETLSTPTLICRPLDIALLLARRTGESLDALLQRERTLSAMLEVLKEEQPEGRGGDSGIDAALHALDTATVTTELEWLRTRKRSAFAR